MPRPADPRSAEMQAVMRGFDPYWADPAHYIIGITKAIWEDRKLHTLRRYYGDAMAVRSPGSIVVGSDKVIGATMATLAEWPDRRLLAEDVIWSPIVGDGPVDAGEPTGGFLSSHRIISTATHTRPGMYGTPTGKRLRYRIQADCAARDNAIFDEWLIRDQGAIVRQMGWDPKAFAHDLIEREGGPEKAVVPFHPDHDSHHAYLGKGNDHPVGADYAGMLHRMMDAEMSLVKTGYDRAAQLELPGGVTEFGRAAADAFWIGLRASLPDASFKIHHTIGRNDPMFSPRAAVRWSLTGKHDGWGTFGRPTGSEVHVMGISHAEYGPWGLRREWTIFDEVAVWKQIALQTG